MAPKRSTVPKSAQEKAAAKKRKAEKRKENSQHENDMQRLRTLSIYSRKVHTHPSWSTGPLGPHFSCPCAVFIL